MSERLERITPEMDEEEALGLILDELMDRAEPDVAEAIRFCAIVHWFDEEILAWLRGEGREPSQRTREILAALTELTFVSPYHDRGYAYHENVRNLLLHRWRQESAEHFQELSGVAAAYYTDKLEVEKLSEEQRAEWQREEMYHLLVSDEERGFGLFQDAFDEATKFYRLSTCSLLLQLAGEFREQLSEEHQQWLRYDEGQLAHSSARWDEALGFFEALLEQELVDELRGEVLNDVGGVYQYKGEWERAKEYYERSLVVLEKISDKHRMAIALANLGIVYQAKREWDKAFEHLQQSLAIAEVTGNEYVISRNLGILGTVYQGKREWDKAIEYYQRSLEILEKVGDEYGMAPAFNNLGLVYDAKGEWDKAIEYYQRSLEILEKVGDEVGAATTMRNVALLYEGMERYHEAVELLERAVRIRERVGHPDLISDRETLERVRKKAG